MSSPKRRQQPESARPSSSSKWDIAVDEKTGRYYYWNRYTQQTVWTCPKDFVLPEWKECIDAMSGKKYYYNMRTKTASFTKPNSNFVPALPLKFQPKLQNNGGEDGDTTDATTNNGNTTNTTTPGDPEAERRARRKEKMKREGYWKESMDKSSGQKYYFHTRTKESVWVKPDVYVDLNGKKKKLRSASRRRRIRDELALHDKILPKNMLRVAVENQSDPIGRVFVAEPADTSLAQLRFMINEHVSSLPPYYVFLMKGAPVGLRQEDKRRADYFMDEGIIFIRAKSDFYQQGDNHNASVNNVATTASPAKSMSASSSRSSVNNLTKSMSQMKASEDEPPPPPPPLDELSSDTSDTDVDESKRY